jgi:PEGA domain-containing protein
VTRFLRPTVLTLSLLATIAMPAIADAQRRVAVPRSRANVIVGARSYSPHYFYRPYYYGPYYRSFYPYYAYPYNSFAFSVGFGWGYPSYGYGAYGYPYYGYPYAYQYYGGFYDPSSSVRLQVTPREAEVYVDGYFAGMVDNFDGTFQRLRVAPGDHELQLFMPGHRSFSQKVYLQPGATFRVRHTMEPLAAGEAEPTRPVATPRSSSVRPEPYGRPDRPNSRGPQRPPPNASQRNGNAESGFGSVALRVQPGDAAITIDGEPWQGAADQDPLVVQLGAGTHTVEIRKDGYRTYIQDVIVRRGETTPLNVSLTRQ